MSASLRETGSRASTEPQSSRGLGPAGFDPARKEAAIWSYARALGKALIQLAPKDFRMEWSGSAKRDTISVSCTLATLQEAEAVCEMILHIARSQLTSHREGIRGDIYPDEPKPSWREELAKALGPCIMLNRDSDTHRMAETEGLGAKPE